MSHPYDALLAIERGDVGRLKELLAEEPALAAARDEQGVSLVLRARYRFQNEAVEALLALRPELDLFTAAAVGDTRRLGELLERDASSAEAYLGDGFTALQLACFFAQPECARLLIERGANVEAISKNGMDLRALHAAAAGRSPECVELLLEHGADPNSQQHGGWTPLHAAVGSSNARTVALLLARGADPRKANEFGQTPLDLALEKKNAEILSLVGA
ncbi:MAG: ankyrin repeat domain-containing protein [Planctomycetes bacterium]|nr:ankyrin repeat domain-containing protein [Planctomycetota bacterium]